MADYIIFQSNWAMNYVGWWIANKVRDKYNSSIIYNGVDTDYFFFKDKPGERFERYLYIHANRDENKRFPEAAMYFYKENKKNSNVELWLIGSFSPELSNNNFDFFNDEKVSNFPATEDKMVLGDIMRKCKYLLFPAYADASPNTVAEAMACGLKIESINFEGGTS
jgi:glycosyltransferase involved in cell wall biosynthesis